MLGKLKDFQIEDNKISFSFSEGEAQVELLRADIVNVFIPYESKEHRSKAIEQRPSGKVNFTVTKEADAVVVTTDALTVKVYDDFYIDFYKADGTLLCADYRGARKMRPLLSEKSLAVLKAEGHDVSAGSSAEHIVQAVKVIDANEKFYGLGDKTGFLNKRSYDYENWNSDLPQAHTDGFKALYKSVPFFLTLKDAGVYGIFFDNTYKSYVDFGKESPEYFYFGADAGNLDYYFIAGERMTDVVSGYTYLTGTTPLPQLWALGYHQSRWGYDSADSIRKVAKKYRELEIPCESIHFDIDYMDGYRVFTWNEQDYGVPGGVIKELSEDGFKPVCIIDPGVKVDEDYYVYKEGMANGYFAKTPEGDVYVNAVWPGDSVYPDFGNPKVRTWWAGLHKYLIDLGARGVWTDMNEPASFHGELPLDVVFTDEDEVANHARMHNVYGHNMAKATYEGLKAIDGKRPFVIARACYAGSQKYTTVWTGDNQSLWAHLQMAIPQLCNMGLSGLSFIGTDVGGFGSDCTPELLSRWVQVGAFSPLFRNHSCNGCIYQEPWQFGKEVVDINRKFIRLRYQLLPYMYDLFFEGEKTGLPIIRPLVLHYEHDKETWNLNDEFLFGERILVAPVVTQGSTRRMVYLPEGTWYGWEDKKEYKGGQYYLVDAPLDTCPIFVKAGSVIPTYEVMQYTGERPYDVLKLLVFPGEGRYVHYQDNGSDFAYRDGEYNAYEFVSDNAGNVTTKMLHQGYEKTYRSVETVDWHEF
ncbi:MAG: glycoside hydrolase family 31 protein [Roseburia sp.]|nr:glycoside hydrolase family 31 protein [Roseburia sp.]